MIPTLHVLFLLSGAAGLLYELVWSRYLALFVGHAAYAQVLVMGIYLGGMGLGAVLVGARGNRVRRPLLGYAVAEYGLAALGVAFPWVFDVVTAYAYAEVFPSTAGSAALTATKWVLAALLILPQSVLLGATFPLMVSAAARRSPDRAGASVASFYFVNALGGAAGVLIGGFVLLGRVGLPGTVGLAAVLNLVAALGAWLVARTGQTAGAASSSADLALPAPGRGASAHVPGGRSGVGWGLLLPVAFFTAVASFAYEIAWLRMLALVMGAATHAFELMLSAFLLGLALGALAVRRWADRHPEPWRLLGRVQWWMGFAALATLPVYVLSFRAMAGLIRWLDMGGSYALFNVARYGLALVVMLPATALAGMTLPLLVAALLRRGGGERAIGLVYGVNTFGSIAGVALAGLVALPALGLKGLLVAGAVLDMGLGVALLGRGTRGRFGPLPLAGATVVVAVLTLTAVRLDEALLTSGVFRYGRLETDRPVLFYEDGRTATVSVHVTGTDSLVVLSTNGKPDASLTRRWIDPGPSPERRPIEQQDEATQSLTALIALAHAPEARTGAVIGHGSGTTAHFLLGSPVLRSLTTVEIEPQMYAASRVYYPANRRAFDDPRARRVVADARSYFAQAGRRYDLVLSEPSNPWVSGIATLFTVEFYEQVKRYLAPDGVFGQWIHLYEIDDELVATVLAAVHASFGDYRVFATADTDLLIVATPAAELPEPDWRIFQVPAVAGSLAHVPALGAPYLEATRLVDRAALAPLLDRWPAPNTDRYPVLDLGAERARLTGGFARGLYGLTTNRFSFGALLESRTTPLPDRLPAPTVTISRMASVAVAAGVRRLDATGLAPPTPGLDAAYGRLLAFRRRLSRTAPPEDWSAFLLNAAAVEADVHGIPQTPVYEPFYDALSNALEGWAAPSGARTAVVYLRALAGGDAETALNAALRLLALERRGERWVDPRVLLEGGVASAVRLGDAGAGRRLLRQAAPLTDWPGDDVRLRWMRAALGDPTGVRAGR